MKSACQAPSLFLINGQKAYEYFGVEPPSCSEYKWRDAGWLSFRKKYAEQFYWQPMNVYQVHLDSWRHHQDGSSYNYTEIARELAIYVKQMGYTHVALLPLTECADPDCAEDSVGSYFVPSDQYGTALDFMSFVDSMHEAGIGVLIDLCIEEAWQKQINHKERTGIDQKSVYSEQTCLWACSALFWIEQYHIDGFCLALTGNANTELAQDALSHNEDFLQFLKSLGTSLKQAVPDILLIAKKEWTVDMEESPFDLIWNQAWSNDLSAYAVLDPILRKYHHDRMTHSLIRVFDKKNILPVSNVDVSRGKKSFLGKMSGDYWQQFASARVFLGYMMTHPGKKWLFMGCEIGQFREWNPCNEVEWFLLQYESHAKLQRYVADLNHFYLANASLWQQDGSCDGFSWIDADNRDQSILSFRRIAPNGEELLILLNFTPVVYEDFRVGVPVHGIYEELFNSDHQAYGGSGVLNMGDLTSEAVPWNYLPQSVRLRVPPLGMTVLHCRRMPS